jgi:8-oxo-dGTP diphosphatase
MHKIFGIKEQEKYYDRLGAYIIPIRDDEIGVVETPKGYFLLGGGLKTGETHFQCIERECMEEAGYLVEIEDEICSAETYMFLPELGYFHPIQTYYVGKLLNKVKESVEPDHIFKYAKFEDIKDNMCLEMQRWAIEQALSHELPIT